VNYYNEIDPYCCEWLRNLISERLIPKGDVDERSIKDVSYQDVKGYIQCHFFAGIGGWAEALQLAGWPGDRPVWTGSCPCQPFSAAGKRKGVEDERHLWPEFYRLIRECAPPIVFGEQVASSDGRKWLAGVRADLEALGYGVGASDLCAASAGAPHIRQRLFWVADNEKQRRGQGSEITSWGYQGGDANERAGSLHGGAIGGMGNTELGGLQRGTRRRAVQQLAHANPWAQFDSVHCADGKARRIESGTFPLAHGVPARVGKLRAYGNAIVPQVAAQFIRAMI
jgi:DNA (cytosine-5)-methyltransferase 1